MYLVRFNEDKFKVFDTLEEAKGFELDYTINGANDYADELDLEIGEEISGAEASYGFGEPVYIYKLSDVIEAVKESELDEEEQEYYVSELKKGKVKALSTNCPELIDILDEL